MGEGKEGELEGRWPLSSNKVLANLEPSDQSQPQEEHPKVMSL